MSSRQPESPEPAVVDTVVLRYFVLVDRIDLLLAVLGEPIHASRIVFEPNDTATDELLMSEIVRSIHVQRARADDPTRDDEARSQATMFATRLTSIGDHVTDGSLVVVDMTDDERDLYARLSSNAHASEFGLRLALGDGEAATLAIALGRGWVFASDDSDALTALESLQTGHPYQRIRRILITAAERDLITRGEANSIHDEMRAAGFWDKEKPFSKG